MESRLRAERLYFWPDPRNATARQLGELLAGRDPAALTAEGFVRASAAVQGLPAVERLLFDEGAAAAFRRGGDVGRRRCEVLEAITRNVAGITGEVAREWSRGDAAYARRVETAGPGNVTYPEPKEATQDLLKSLHAGARAGRHPQARQAPRRVAGRGPPDPGRGVAERARAPGRAPRPRRPAGAVSRRRRDRPERVRPGRRRAPRSSTSGSAVASTHASRPPTGCRVHSRWRSRAGAPDRRWSGCSQEVRDLTHTVAEHLTTALDLPLGFNALDGD